MADTGNDKKRALHAYLSEEAHATWNSVAEEFGVSMTGLLEAMAQQWAEQSDKGFEDVVDGDLVKRARRIDVLRRRRNRGNA